MLQPVELNHGINYFPLDVHSDDRYKLVEAEHGVIGFGIIIKLFQKIYENGYYYEWNKPSQLIFSRDCNIEIEKINLIINSALEWKLFDKMLFEKYNILTSSEILKQFLEITKRRKSVTIIKEYTEFEDHNLDVNIYAKNVNILPLNDNIFEQRKEKETKEKERNINNNKIIINSNFNSLNNLNIIANTGYNFSINGNNGNTSYVISITGTNIDLNNKKTRVTGNIKPPLCRIAVPRVDGCITPLGGCNPSPEVRNKAPADALP